MKFDKELRRKLCASMLNIAIFLSIFSGMIILLLAFIAPNVSADHNPTIYVDDDGSDLGDGSPGNPYNKIEKALDDAYDDTGDVLIIVYNGTYEETLTIETGDWDTLTLQGNHSSNTTIDAQGSGTVITVSASWCNITGFTIKNGGGSEPYGIRLKSDNNDIYDCIITDNSQHGIYLNGSSGSHNNMITYNIISNNGKNGICLKNSDYNDIENNTIDSNTGTGISLCIYERGRYYGDNDFNRILDNNITNNGKGIYLRLFSSDNTIIGNNILYNGYGIMIHPHFGLGSPCDNNSIVDNNITYNDFDGIFLVHSSDNNIIGNNISHNGDYGLHLYGASNNNTIISNTLYSNTVSSMHLRTSSNENRIINNTIYFGNYGIALNSELEPSAGACVNNYFFNNTIICANYSIYIYNANNNTFYNTTIINPEIYGLFIKTNIETNYINFLPNNNTVNDDPIHHYYDEHDLIFSNPENLTQHKVTNVGKITLYACSKITISNKTISNGTIGIFIHSSDNITVDDNIISNMTEVGLHVENGYWHDITLDNTVDGEIVHYYTNQTDITIENLNLHTWNISNVGKITLAYCKNVFLINNNVSHNDFGIFLWGCKEITMWNNTMLDPKSAGLFIEEGYHHYIPDNNTANGQQIYYFTDIHGSEGNPIINDTFSITNEKVSNVGLITYANCSYLIIENNTLSNNYGSGLFIASSFNIIVRNNTVQSNTNGISLMYSTNINVTKNHATYNTKGGYGKNAGIYLGFSHDNIISNNTEIKYNKVGIYLESSKNDLITRHNDTIKNPISMYSSSPHIYDNNFTCRTYATYSSPTFEQNYFYTTGSYIAVSLVHCNSSTKIINNTVNFDINLSTLNIKALHVSFYLMYSSPLIENNTSLFPIIPINHPKRGVPPKHDLGQLGHMAIYFNSSPVIRNNYFRGNSWGLSLMGSSWACIENNTINGTDIAINVASSDQLGPGEDISNTASYAIINNNTINNTHNWGINFNQYNNGTVTNNSILYSGGFNGVGIRMMGGASQYITNNNVSYNDIGIKSAIYSPCSPDPAPTISNNDIIGNDVGITSQGPGSSGVIDGNTVVDNGDGIDSCNSNSNIINNIVLSNTRGILVREGGAPFVKNNYISWSVSYGIYIQNSLNCLIYHNNLINNTIQAYDNTNDGNQWDNGYPSGGNYWSDYNGSDYYKGPGQNISGSDGIGDTNYTIDSDSQDNYPLIDPWGLVHNINKDLWYFTIQKAIDEADSGNSLEAMMGTYHETVILNKTVNITGKYGATKTIIDGGGSGDVVKITADWVNITGFSINNSGSSDGDAGIELNNVQNCYIANNSINNNTKGILLNFSSHNNIYNNTISSNGQQGIELVYSNWNKIESNIVSSNSWEGINIKNTSNNNTITECTIILNTGWGISIDSSNDNNLNNNSVSNNSIGIYTYQTSNTLIEENIISYNDCGIQMYYASPIIQYNDISYNIGNGIGEIYYTDIQLCNNTITYNSASGICNVLYSNGTIDNNTISYNNEGISCFQYSSPSVTYNNITYNSIGIDSRSGSNASIHWNNIHDNENYNLKNLDEEIIIDATYNYWGSDDENDILEGLYGEVTYDPWLSNAVEEAGPD